MEIMRWCAFLLLSLYSYTDCVALIYTCHTRAGSAGTSNSCITSGNAAMLRHRRRHRQYLWCASLHIPHRYHPGTSSHRITSVTARSLCANTGGGCVRERLDVVFSWSRRGDGGAIPLYNTLAVPETLAGSPEPVRAPGPLDPSTLPESEPARVGLQTGRAMINAGWPALARLSFLPSRH